MQRTPEKPLVLGIVGPSAAGKTEISLRLAEHLSVEIVCMDSMQVYRGMDIGTAKPNREDRLATPHHMLDVADPQEPYSVARYAIEAKRCMEEILARGRRPLVVGGTGLYLRALSQSMTLGYAPADPVLREGYRAILESRGKLALHAMLVARDPEAASRLHPNDSRRVVRALEVFELTGRSFFGQQLLPDMQSPYTFRLFAPMWPREALYKRADERIGHMLRQGLVEEVEGLLFAGVSKDAHSMQGLGYKELIPFLEGEISLREAWTTIALRTRRFIKRQLTWFRGDGRVLWLPVEDGNGADAVVDDIIKRLREDGCEWT